jgi:hypothetical protein
MKLGRLALLLVVAAVSACGGGSSSSDPGGSPTTLAAGFTPDQPSPGANTAAMAKGPTNNDVVTVNITLTGTNGVYGTAFDVSYDSTHTVFLGFTPGTVFEQGGNTPNYTVTPNPSGNPPKITVGVARTNGTATNVSGTSTVLGLQFRVKQAGVYPLFVENAVVYDGQPTPQPIPGITWYAGAVTGA